MQRNVSIDNSGRNQASVLVTTSQLSPMGQFGQSSLYSPNHMDNQIIYRDYAAAAAAAVYASSNQAAAAAAASYLSPAHGKHTINHQSNGGNGGLFVGSGSCPSGSGSSLGSLNIPVPPPAHHQSSSSSSSVHHHMASHPHQHHSHLLSSGGTLSGTGNSIGGNSHVPSSYTYSHGLTQSGNPLPAHIQQTSTHSYSQLHGSGPVNGMVGNSSAAAAAAAMSAIQFTQPNYASNYVGPIQPLGAAASKQAAAQYSNLYQLFAD